jgi:hypothetical protein
LAAITFSTFFDVNRLRTSGWPSACRRVNDKIRRDKKLKRNVGKIEKIFNMSRMNTCPLWFLLKFLDRYR